jgi:hypothetical protein
VAAWRSLQVTSWGLSVVRVCTRQPGRMAEHGADGVSGADEGDGQVRRGGGGITGVLCC